MNEIIAKKCIICQKGFNCKTSPRRKSMAPNIRPAKSHTCSRECARTYQRVYKVARARCLAREKKGE